MQLGPSAGMSGKSEAQQTMGKRAFGNLHEQSIAFLVALWSHALFLDVDGAARMGWAYLALRAFYPVIWCLCGGFSMKVLAVTMPMYGIVVWLMGTTVAQVNFGLDLKATAAFGSDFVGCVEGVVLF